MWKLMRVPCVVVLLLCAVGLATAELEVIHECETYEIINNPDPNHPMSADCKHLLNSPPESRVTWTCTYHSGRETEVEVTQPGTWVSFTSDPPPDPPPIIKSLTAHAREAPLAIIFIEVRQ